MLCLGLHNYLIVQIKDIDTKNIDTKSSYVSSRITYLCTRCLKVKAKQIDNTGGLESNTNIPIWKVDKENGNTRT